MLLDSSAFCFVESRVCCVCRLVEQVPVSTFDEEMRYFDFQRCSHFRTVMTFHLKTPISHNSSKRRKCTTLLWLSLVISCWVNWEVAMPFGPADGGGA